MNRESLDWILIIIACFVIAVSGQQSYEYENSQLNCDPSNSPDIAYGYTCNGQQQTCQAYAIYRAQAGYQNLANISLLLNSSKSQMAQINELSDSQLLAIDKAVIAPIDCSCVGNHSQANTTYIVQSGDTYSIMANNTYQGLSTCQAMMQQNSVSPPNLVPGMSLNVPLRCACPTSAQAGQGFKYLLSYLVRKNDNLDAIGQRYGATVQQLFDANSLTSNNNTIYPETTILVPLKAKPSSSPAASPPPPPPASIPQSPSNSGSNSGSNPGLRIGLGVGIAAVVIAVGAVTVGWIVFRRKKMNRCRPGNSSSEPRKPEFNGKIKKPSAMALDELAVGIQEIGQTLPRYKLKELEAATANFSLANRIAGSVYRGIIDETPVAVKQIQGAISEQIGILQRLNHFNLVRLSGFCEAESRSYLVFEYAENGSLADYLQSNSPVLSWWQRLEIALDVANGLGYLHNYAVPAYVHKDIKSSNVLLDGNFRAKIANFGLAKSAGEGFAVTRHVVGTKGYMAPEYLAQGLVTPKLDVFSFGVVMLELLSGKPAAFPGDGDLHKEVMLWTTIGVLVEGSNPKEKLKGFMDPALKDGYPLDMAFAMAGLARTCVDEDLNRRPSINEIQMNLSSWLSASSHSYDLESIDSFP